MVLEKFQINFIDRDIGVIYEYSKTLSYFGNFYFNVGDFFQNINKPSLIATPGNSYGIMDGGFDLEIKERFEGIEDRIKNIIDENYGGELEIGQTLIAPTENPTFPYLFYTPTIKKPGELSNEKDIYKASRSLFEALKEFSNKDESIPKMLSLPGFGTGYGNLDPNLSGNAILKAYLDSNK